MKWMESYTDFFDRKGYNDGPWSDWWTEDHVLYKADGTTVAGAEKAWEAAKEVYAPFSEYTHIPYYLVCHDTDDGWEMIGQAHLYGNLVGERHEGEAPKVKDKQGREWDVCIPGAFRFQYVKGKGKHGMALKRTDIHSDSMPAGMTLIKRGVIKLG